MARNNELKETDIKNCKYYYFGNVISVNDVNLNHILLDKKSHENCIHCI